MGFSFEDVKAPQPNSKRTDPIELFQELNVRDSAINDLWLAQGDALREWHKSRRNGDVAIVLNTGAGKTLVGLLIAQSLVNELKGNVVYACSSKQLVEQTAEKAESYGLKVTTYHSRVFSNDYYQRRQGPCITTYQALFNGWSRFFQERPEAIVFDDAHSAEHLIRDQYSLVIDRGSFEQTYKELHHVFHGYFRSVSRGISFQELLDGHGDQFLVPPSELIANKEEVSRILADANFDSTARTRFPWAYLRDHIESCAVIFDSAKVTVTPPFLPVLTLPYFEDDIKRVYLSAKLDAPDAFARTFGRVPEPRIAPSTTAGECERLVIIPSRINDAHDEIRHAKEAIADEKALILTPSFERAKEWEDVADVLERSDFIEGVRKFRESDELRKISLAGRFDGLDFPGDTCRVLVIDDLPTGVGALERFLWEKAEVTTTLRTTVASRIIQSFGRTSRGVNDYGIVLLTGERLVEWLLIPRNKRVLPDFLQKQLEIGFQVSEAATPDNVNEAIQACLARDDSWRQFYQERMATLEADSDTDDHQAITDAALGEAQFAQLVWERKYREAAQVMHRCQESTFDISPKLGAWHSLWIGQALELAGDEEGAAAEYSRAHSIQKRLPEPCWQKQTQRATGADIQVVEIGRQFRISGTDVACPKNLDQDLAALDGGYSAKETEESIRLLGQLLGLDSERPEKEYGTGPDVLWKFSDGSAWCIEVKTDKSQQSVYKKQDLGQLRDHQRWAEDKKGIETPLPVFVGPAVSTSPEANPDASMQVLPLDGLKEIAEKLKALYQDVASNALPISLQSDIEDRLNQRGLAEASICSAVPMWRLSEL